MSGGKGKALIQSSVGFLIGTTPGFRGHDINHKGAARIQLSASRLLGHDQAMSDHVLTAPKTWPSLI